jgi:MerR family transcriptional regulator, light-induced transcriptional regulator
MAGMESAMGQVRIGELSRRSGVSPELLRAWERRYGLLRPTRSDGGFRLYSSQDERRVALMREHLGRGLSAAQAARLAIDDATEVVRTYAMPTLARGAAELRAALDALDESAAHATLDRLLAGLSVETVLGEVVLPYLRELGERWAGGDASVGQEHFASNVLRGRLLGLARGWDAGRGPRALLACPPGEQHDLALIAFGLGLRDRGWRITYLGPDTPFDTLADTARAVEPAAVVLAGSTTDRFEGAERALRRLARGVPLWLAGAGATAQLAKSAGAQLLDVDPLAAVDRVANAAVAT